MKFSFAFLAVLLVTRTLEINAVPIHNGQYNTLVNTGLPADLQDFLSLVPVDKIQEIFYQYLADDEDFGAALDYVLSDEFKSLITEIEAEPEVRELLNYLEDAGLATYAFINKINDLLGIDRISPRTSFAKISGGLPGFIKDVKAVLPIDKIEKLYNEKLKTSKDFAELVRRLSSQEFQGLIDKIMANPKLQNLMKRAEAKGVDVQAILDFFTSILGLKFPSRPVVFSLTRNLKDDLNDLLALVPVDKIEEIFYEYLAEDEDFGEALDYILSDEFKSLITEVEAQSEVILLLNFLQESGLDAYGFVNKINDLLGIDRITPRIHLKADRITGGLPGFIKDITAVLPIDKIEKLYNEKLKTSKDFAELVRRLSSQEFQGLIDKIMANPKLQNLMKRAEAKGVDVQAILDFFTSILGLKFPSRPVVFSLTRNLKDDLNDLLALVPVDKIEEIFYEYLAEDEDFGEALDYILSDEFKSLITEVEAQSEVILLLNFLQESGLDAYGFVNKINDLLGIDRITPRIHLKADRITGGLPGFIKDITAVLPIDKIEKLYNEKLKTSKDFAELVRRLSSQEFQGLIDKIMANPKLQNLMKRAEAKGVDVQAILDFFTSILGLKFPSRPVVYSLTRNLKDDLNDLLALVPVDKIEEIFYEYLAEDEDFGEALDYILSDEFKSLITEVEAQSEVILLLNFLQESGLDAYGFVNKINDLLGIDRITPRIHLKADRITGGLPGFIKDITAVLPIDKIEKLYNEKLKTSKDFAELVRRLSSQEFQGLIDKIMANPKLQNLMKRAEAKGVDVQAILDFFTSILGLKFPSRPVVFSLTRNLKDDLNDLLALVPVDKIEEIFYEYLAEDEDFGEALDYILSDEFKSLITEVEAQSEVILLLNFLQESGLDAYGFVNKINDLLGIDRITPRIHLKADRITGGLPGFIKDITAVLPIDKIEKLYNEKLKTSKDFAELVRRLSSQEFQGLIDKIMANPKLQNLMKRAEAKGVDVQAILDFFTSILGLKFPSRPVVYSLTRNLKDDLNDLLALVPVDKIEEIFYEYLAEDEDFGEALDYILSDEFKSLITEVEAQSEVILLLNFLQESGLDAYGFVNKINDLLGIDRITPRIHLKADRITGGLPGFIKDITAVLPIDKIEKLYNEKLKTSKDFAELVRRLSSQEFQGLIDKIMANPKLQNLMKRAEAKGVDVQAILDFFTSILGLKFPSRPVVFSLTRNLKDDLNDLLALVPVDKIQDIFYEYLAEDEDFGEALDYILSDEFKSLITEVEAQSEVILLLNFLQESGLDAYGFVNKINDLLGIDRITPRIHLKADRITGGLPGFIKDITAVLPIDKIEKLYNEKLKTSKDFAELVRRLSSQEFQGLIDKIMANPKLQNLMKRAEAKGVDVQAILDFFTSILGLKFPSRPVVFSLTRNLQDDLNDFLALIPFDKIQDIFYEYLAEDEDFGEALDYLMSDEFKSLVVEVETQPEVLSILKYLQESGLDAYEIVNKINDLLGIDRITPRRYNKVNRITGGLTGFFKDIAAVLPLKEIENLYIEKMASSKEFYALIKELSSPQFQKLVDQILANPNMQNLIRRAEAKGLDVQSVFDFLSNILGLEFPWQRIYSLNRNLKDDLNDFLALVPVEKIQEIFYEYLAEDESFGEALDYLLSEEFKGLVIEIEAQKEVKDLLNFLQQSGLQAYEFINKINDLLGINHVAPRNYYGSNRITGGLPGFIQDIKATLPVDEIEKLFQEKLKTSPDFSALIKRLSSDEFQGLVDRLLDNAELQNLIKRAEAKGVDVQAIFDFFSSLLGLKFPSRPVVFKEEEVIDILRQIWAKVPTDSILDIIVEYLIEDEDFKKVVKFMMNDDFKTILLEIEDLSEIRVLLKFMHETGLDVYKWINELHDLIGLDVQLPLLNNYNTITGGVPGLLKDIRSLLPLDELYTFYDEKLKTSSKFREFIHRLEKQELQNAVNALNKHNGFNLMLNKLEALGVDWDAVTEIISAIIGIKFPQRPH